MSESIVTIYKCDFCGKEVRSIVKGWFVLSVNGDTKAHACHECGVSVRNAIAELGIPVEFHCTEYGENWGKFGWIEITKPDSNIKLGIIYKASPSHYPASIWLL